MNINPYSGTVQYVGNTIHGFTNWLKPLEQHSSYRLLLDVHFPRERMILYEGRYKNINEVLS